MPPRSKVHTLPPNIKRWLDEALIDGNFSDYKLLTNLLKDKGYDISRSGLHRYGQDFERNLQALKLATEQAKAVQEAIPDDEGALPDALLRIVQQKAFDMLVNLEADPNVRFSTLAKIATESSFASTNLKEFRRKVKEKAQLVAKEVTDTIKKAGLSDEAVDQIKKRILGVAE